MASLPERRHVDYTIGWIRALPVELAVAKLMLDEIHPGLPQRSTDSNVYLLGECNGHNVVIACLPLGVYGISSASIVATQMISSFPAMRFSLLVGLGGGVPGVKGHDIRLGDVVVSKPTGTFGGVVQYDYGRTISTSRFQRTGALNKPPSILLAAVSRLQAEHMTDGSQMSTYLARIMERYSIQSKFSPPDSAMDILFESSYRHMRSADGPCSDCSTESLVRRPHRVSDRPQVYYGTIASANQVIKDGMMRDHIARSLDHGILCFEMEAAGLMDNLPCTVICGICDYADSHKNKQWQPCAAIVASAYAKELLSVIPVPQIENAPVLPRGACINPASERQLNEMLRLTDEEETPLQKQLLEIGPQELIQRAHILAMSLGRYSWFRLDCKLINLEGSTDRLWWICCHCGEGPMDAGRLGTCSSCGHSLVSR